MGNVVGMDVKGREGHKWYWRTVVFFGRGTVSSTFHKGEQKLLDQFIESACIAKNTNP